MIGAAYLVLFNSATLRPRLSETERIDEVQVHPPWNPSYYMAGLLLIIGFVTGVSAILISRIIKRTG